MSNSSQSQTYLELPHKSAVPCLDIYPRDQKHLITQNLAHILVEAVLTIARNKKQSKCPSAGGWINKMWYIVHKTEYYLAVKRNEVLIQVLNSNNFKRCESQRQRPHIV